VAFWVAGATLTLFLCGASAPSPLYAIYQAKFGFSATVLTAIFAVYAVAVLVTVLPAGELSDQVGRRPVILFGLALQIVATVVFLVANDVALLFVGRILQGISVGVVIGALSALLVDLQDRGSALGPLVASVASPLGLAAGAILAGVLVEYAARCVPCTGCCWRCSRWQCLQFWRSSPKRVSVAPDSDSRWGSRCESPGAREAHSSP
jgi:MFS family permease